MGNFATEPSRASIGKAVNYVTKDEKTEEKLISGKDCNPQTAIDEMKATKEIWGKTTGREYYHFVQSFSEEEQITPKEAHEIAEKLAIERFKGHEVVIATHQDKRNQRRRILELTILKLMRQLY